MLFVWAFLSLDWSIQQEFFHLLILLHHRPYCIVKLNVVLVYPGCHQSLRIHTSQHSRNSTVYFSVCLLFAEWGRIYPLRLDHQGLAQPLPLLRVLWVANFHQGFYLFFCLRLVLLIRLPVVHYWLTDYQYFVMCCLVASSPNLLSFSNLHSDSFTQSIEVMLEFSLSVSLYLNQLSMLWAQINLMVLGNAY